MLSVLVILLIAAFALGFLFGHEHERLFAASFATMWVFGLEMIGVGIYVAHHFIVKYW